jgi:hypothetical protein
VEFNPNCGIYRTLPLVTYVFNTDKAGQEFRISDGFVGAHFNCAIA